MAKKKKGGRRKQKLLPTIIKTTGVWVPAASAIPQAMAGDMEGAAKHFAGNLVANYTGYNPVEGQWQPANLAIGWGPPLVMKLMNKLGVRINWPI